MKHRWRKSSQHDLSCVWEAGIVTRKGNLERERLSWKLAICVEVFFIFYFLFAGHGAVKMDGVLAVAHLQIHNYLGDAAKNSDEIENIPSISKVVLQKPPPKKQQQHFSQLGCDQIHFSDRRGRLCWNRFVYSLFGLITHDKTKRHDLEDTLQ